MEYEMMIPPFSHCEFSEMTKKEAQLYFEWFVSQVGHRISILNNYIVNDGGNLVLDYSIESLIPLWRWYEGKIQTVLKDDEDYRKEIERHPVWMKQYISQTTISNETLKIGLDVSMYFAEVIIRNSAGKIKWGYFCKPKKRISVNEPTLLGFEGGEDLNPRLIILNCTRKSSKEANERRLYDMYNIWMVS